jgi:hypothetical protein
MGCKTQTHRLYVDIFAIEDLTDILVVNHTASAKTLYVSLILWSVASSCVRLSVLCLYYRLLRHCQSVNERYHLWALHGMAAITISLLLIYLGTGIFTCM